MDKSVWIIMLSVIIAAGLFTGSRFMTMEKCPSFKIVTPMEQVKQGDTVKFELKGIIPFPDAGAYWQFGDSSSYSKGATIKHVFNSAGDYDVVATVDNRCSEIFSLTVSNAKVEPEKPIANITLPSGPYKTGVFYEFEDNTPGAKSWKWDMGSKSVDSEKRKFKYRFPEPGKYTIKLYINDNNHEILKREIIVAKGQDVRHGKKIKNISESEFKEILQALAKLPADKKEMRGQTLHLISPYLENTKVSFVVHRDGKTYSFTWYIYYSDINTYDDRIIQDIKLKKNVNNQITEVKIFEK